MNNLTKKIYFFFAIPIFYLFLPNFLIGDVYLEYKGYLILLLTSLFVSYAIFFILQKSDSKFGLVNEEVTVNQKFWSFSGIGLACGSLCLAILISVNSLATSTPIYQADKPLTAQYSDSNSQEFCPLGLPGNHGRENGTPFLCLLTLHSPRNTIFVGSDKATDEQNCMFYDIEKGRLGLKFLKNHFTCAEKKSSEISRSLQTLETDVPVE